MDRRVFLKLSGLAAAASALGASPVAAAGSFGAPSGGSAAERTASATSGTRLTISEPGTYRISGFVRLEQPLVEIGGITNSQWVSWSDAAGSENPVVGFTTFEQFDRPGMMPDIRVRGGQLQAVTAVPIDLE